MFLTKNSDASEALQIFLGLRDASSPKEELYIHPDDGDRNFDDARTAVQEWFSGAIKEFSDVPLDQPNPRGDCVWAAINGAMDSYRVGEVQVSEDALYVSRLAVMRFGVAELQHLECVKALDEAKRELIGEFLDDAAEGDFLPRTNAKQLIETIIEISLRGGDVNNIADSFFEPIYQLVESWSGGDTNCHQQPFFETGRFGDLWERQRTSILAEKASSMLNTYFWYRKREHSGTYAVTAHDSLIFVAKLATLAGRLGERGFERLFDRAKFRFDEQQDEMEAQNLNI